MCDTLGGGAAPHDNQTENYDKIAAISSPNSETHLRKYAIGRMRRIRLDDLTSRTMAGTFDQSPDNSLAMLIRARLTMFLERDMFTDVTLVTNTSEIRAHSIVLAGASLFFEAHLSYVCDGDAREVSVPFNGKLVSKLVNYIYTGKIQFTDDIYDMMALQDFLQVGSLRNLISDYLAVNLNKDNVGKIVVEADRYRYADLATTARRFVVSNFKTILSDEDFTNAPFDLIRESLESDYLVIRSTSELVYNLCRWVAFDEFERRPRLKYLLDRIDPIELDEWFRTKQRCLELFPEKSYSADVVNKWFEENTPQTRPTYRGTGLPRFKAIQEDVILFIGGNEDGQFVPTVEATRRLSERCRRSLPLHLGHDYPIHEPPILIFSSMRLNHTMPFFAVSDGQTVFVTSPSRNVECYQVPKNEWHPLPKFPDSVSLGRITTLDESLFICGPRVKPDGYELWVLPKGTAQWKQLIEPCSSTGDLTQFVSSSLGSTLVGFFKDDDRPGITVQHYDVTLDVWTTTIRLPESWSLITATSIDRRKIFLALKADSWSCYDSVSCSLSDPTRAVTAEDSNEAGTSHSPCQCSDPHALNQSVLLANRTIVQMTCCLIGTYALSTGHHVKFRSGMVTNKSNSAIATIKIGSYGWPKL